MKPLLLVFKKFKYFFLIFLHMKYSLSLPPRKKILLFDANLENSLSRYLKKSDYEILHSRKKNYNFLIFLQSLVKNFFSFSSVDYFNIYIKYVNPKIIITLSDNYVEFYRLNKPKNSKKFFIQNAWRTKQLDIFSDIKKLQKNKKFNNVDYMFVFNQAVGKLYNTFIQGKIIPIGSFRSNTLKIKKYNKKGVLFISHWRHHNVNFKVAHDYRFGDLLQNQIELLKFVYNTCVKKNKKLFIYGKQPKHLNKNEINFYNDILKNKKNWQFIPNEGYNNNKTYKHIDRSELVVSTSSTLGYETLARGTKVAIFNIDNFTKSSLSNSFGWPVSLNAKGPFWENSISQKKCDELIKKILNYSFQEWKKIKNLYCKKLMQTSEDNEKFVKILNKYK